MIELSGEWLLRNAVLGGFLVTLLCAALGLVVAIRRLELLGVALPQAGAAGIALAFWMGGHGHSGGGTGHGMALLGSALGTFVCLGTLLLGRRTVLPVESRVAAAFALASAATVLFVASNPKGDFEVTSLLRGELLAIDDVDLAVLALAASITGALFLLFRREILLASIDPEFLQTLGLSPARWDALVYALLGIAISLGTMMAGPLVVFGFLVLPAAGALRIARGIGGAFAIACGTAAVASLGGFELAFRADLPPGPVEVGVAALPWGIAAIAGLLRRRAARATIAGLLPLALLLAGA